MYLATSHRHRDDQRSETSSAPSSNSGSNSRKGSGASSPSYTPPPSSASPTKFVDSPWDNSKNSCRYFVVKASNNKMLQVSEQKGVWATTSAIDKKLDQAYRVSTDIIFSTVLNVDNYSPTCRPYFVIVICNNVQ